MLQHHPSQLSLRTNETALKLGATPHTRYPITTTPVPGYPGAGMGRIVRLQTPLPLPALIDRIALGLGNPKGFPIAVPQGQQASDLLISSIGICAGSGGSLFAKMERELGEEVDLYFTGELSHHEALAAIERGKCVVALFHSNTERGFLHGVMKPALEEAVAEEVSCLVFFSFSFSLFHLHFFFSVRPPLPPSRPLFYSTLTPFPPPSSDSDIPLPAPALLCPPLLPLRD